MVSSMANLIALSSDPAGDALSRSRLFHAEVYLMEYWLQVCNSGYVVLSSSANGRKSPNSSSVRSLRGLTSDQRAPSVIFRVGNSSLLVVQGKVRCKNPVSGSFWDLLKDKVTELSLNSGITGSVASFGIKSLCVNRLWSPLLMAPRQRGVPRRGGVWGVRRGQPARARVVPPLAIVAPPSSPSEESDPSENNHVHTSRFTFKCRRNQPLISVIVTVIVSEEDEETDSPEADHGEQVRTQNAQMNDEDGNEEAPPPDDIIPVAPADRLATHSHLIPPLEVRLEDMGDGIMLDWLPLPHEANDSAQGEPPKA